MQGDTADNPLRSVAKDLAGRLATARAWARAGEPIVISDVTVGGERCHVTFAGFLDEPERKAERYAAAFGVTFAQDAMLRRFDVRIRIKTHLGAESPPYLAVYVVRRKPTGEALVNFVSFKSPADYERVSALTVVGWFAHWLNASLSLGKTRKLLAERGVASAELGELALEQSCAAFTNALADGGTFEDEDYLAHERGPKESLAACFREDALPALRALLPAGPGPAPTALAELGRGLLPPTGVSGSGRPWLQLRDHHFTQRFDEQEWADFAVAVAVLLDEAAPLSARLDEFNRRLTDCGTRPEQKSSPVQRRSLATYFLSLADPARHLHLDSMLLNRLLLKIDAPRVAPEDLTGTAYEAILEVARALYDFLSMRGFAPRDLLDIHGFMRVVTGHVVPTAAAASPEESSTPVAEKAARLPQNLLIEGVPGVGRLRRAMSLAVEICDGVARNDESSMRRRFETLLREERVCLISLHPGFGYADFVEARSASQPVPAQPLEPLAAGAQPSPAPVVDAPLSVRDGLLKRLARLASGAPSQREAVPQHALRERQIFKLTLGTALDREVEDYCVEHGVIAMAGAEGIDLGTLPRDTDWESAKERITAALSRQHGRPGSVFALWTFKDKLEVGDVVLVPRGARRISAIGVVEGAYRYEPHAPIAAQHFRSVRWFAHDLDVPVEQLYGRPLDQQALYALDAADVDFDALEELMGPARARPGAGYVLVIDGIERADAAAVFGETTLLLDADHRVGAAAALEVTLPVSGERFALPQNLHLIATRDLRGPPIAAHVRMRFESELLEPNVDAIDGTGKGCIERGALDLRRWLSTLNARLAWLVGPHAVLGHAFLARVTSLDAFAHAYRTTVLPHVCEVLGRDADRLLATLGPKLVQVDAPGEKVPLHPCARLSSTSSGQRCWRFAPAPTLADFASLYAPADADG